MKKNMTALVSCFARCYHYKNNKFRVYSDEYAEKILSEDEYKEISSSMTQGIKFFNPNFKGNEDEALRYIVNNQISPSVLGRSAFCEKMLNQEIKLGLKQYLIFASGYDTSAYKYLNKNIEIFEIDKDEMINDKINRINKLKINNKVIYISSDFTNNEWIESIISSKYNQDLKSFNSLMGISYYLPKNDFKKMLKSISDIITEGSSIIFDYQTITESLETLKNEKLAKEANEEMKAKYSYEEIEKMLEEVGLYIYEHLDDREMTNNYFYDYNTLNPNNKIIAPIGVAYCYAVKK